MSKSKNEKPSIQDRFNKKPKEVIKEAAKVLTSDEDKKPLTRKEYNKKYASQQSTIKVSKEVYQIAKENAKKQDRNMKSYIEHLIKKDNSNNDEN